MQVKKIGNRVMYFFEDEENKALIEIAKAYRDNHYKKEDKPIVYDTVLGLILTFGENS